MTKTGSRVRRLFIGVVVGMVLVLGFQVLVQFKPGIKPDTNLGKIDKEARTFAESRTTPYPDATTRNQERRPRDVVFYVEQAGTTQRLNIVSSVDGDAKSTQQRVGRWTRKAPATRPGAVLLLSAAIVANDQGNKNRGPLRCTIVIDGLIYREHFKRHPQGTGEVACQASAVVP